MRRGLVVVAVMALSASAPAQTPPQLGESAKRVIGSWEFSNADRDKKCTATFSAERTAVGFKVEFDGNCAGQFPLITDIVGWKFPDNDLLYLLDSTGKALVEFSEVEDGIYEAPTPGVGVLFLQNAGAAAGPPEKSSDELAGNWLLTRGAGAPLCAFTLTSTAQGEGMAMTVKPGCAQSIAQLNFAQWRLEKGELVLLPGRGAPWRFEEVEGAGWRRVPEGANPMMLVRQ